MKYGVVRDGTIVAWFMWDGVSPHPYMNDELRPLPNNTQPREFMNKKYVPDPRDDATSNMTKARRIARGVESP